MRVVHLSDTHLGFSAYSRLNQDEGVNQREIDFYKAFKQAVDIAIRLKPDLVVHAGDLFDTVRPQNRAIDFALRQLIRLSEEGIETVLISGNHSTPRLKETGNIFRIFEHLEHVHSIHEPAIKQVVSGDVTVTAIPHSSTPPLTQLVQESKPSKDTRFNLLLLHAGIMGPNTYKMDEFNEQSVPASSLPEGFDYIALGHFHRFTEVSKGTCYSGSTERLSFGEAGQEKGIVEVDLSKGSAKFHELQIRDMVDLEPIDASKLASSEILREAKERLSSAKVDDRIARMSVSNVGGEAYRSLDVQAIRRLANSAMHFELKIERAEEAARKESQEAQFGSLAYEFQKYVAALDRGEEKKKMLLDVGTPYFVKEEEE